MKRNFAFDVTTVVCWGDSFIDLHNAYDVEGFGTDLSGCELTIRFKRNEHAINPDELPQRVALTCTGNLKLAFNDLTALAAPLDDEGIEIGYFDRQCDWDLSLDEDNVAEHEPEGLVVSFINGLVIRVRCDVATFSTG